MPHQCVRCKAVYDDGSKEILKGCSCGCKMFFFIKKDALKKVEEVKLTRKDREQIEEDIYDLVGSQIDRDKPVVLDFESIRILKPGQYELDLVALFKDEPLVFRLEEGKYMIDVQESFKSLRKK